MTSYSKVDLALWNDGIFGDRVTGMVNLSRSNLIWQIKEYETCYLQYHKECHLSYLAEIEKTILIIGYIFSIFKHNSENANIE